VLCRLGFASRDRSSLSAVIRKIGDNLSSHRKLERARCKLALPRRLDGSPDLKVKPTNLGPKLIARPHGAILHGGKDVMSGPRIYAHRELMADP
jgi:hypothetical protein